MATDPIDLINRQRGAGGLAPLVRHPALESSALAQSTHMARWRKLSHTGSWWSTPGGRMRSAGYSWSREGECVAMDPRGAEAVVADWMGDAPHRAILMDPRLVHIGVAAVGPYWTADLATPLPPSPAR